MRHDATPYHRTVSRRLKRSREKRQDLTVNKYISVDRFLNTFETVYNQYYGTSILIRYRHGWYYLGRDHLHKSDLVRMMEKMLVELHVESTNTTGEDESGND